MTKGRKIVKVWHNISHLLFYNLGDSVIMITTTLARRVFMSTKMKVRLMRGMMTKTMLRSMNQDDDENDVEEPGVCRH